MSRFFSERFHMTLTQYVNYVRLKYARHLLESTDLSVTEIAMKSGYPNVSYFIRKFSAAVGEPPLRYRNGKAVKDQKTEYKIRKLDGC